jgi:hypothetical protein
MSIQFGCQRTNICCHPIRSSTKKRSIDAKGKYWSWEDNNGQDGEKERVAPSPSFKVVVLSTSCLWYGANVDGKIKSDEEAKKKQNNVRGSRLSLSAACGV